MERPVIEFSYRLMAKKGVMYAAKFASGWLIAHGIAVSVSIYGFTVDTANETSLTALFSSLLAMGCNWLKVKYPDKFGWL